MIAGGRRAGRHPPLWRQRLVVGSVKAADDDDVDVPHQDDEYEEWGKGCVCSRTAPPNVP